MKVECLFFFFIGVVSIVSAQTNQTNLLCYDCDPKNSLEQCGDPVTNSVTLTNCDSKIPNRNPNDTVVCVSSFLTLTGDRTNETGIYRGCFLQNSSVTNFCDWFREENNQSPNIAVTSCASCNASRCNTHTFSQNGDINGSEILRTAMLVLGASLMFAMLF